jgi:hypothetical protein
MNRLRDSIDVLASRGAPRGADQVFFAASGGNSKRRINIPQRIAGGRELPLRTLLRRPWLTFAAAFAAVLVVGAGLAALTRSAEPPSSAGTRPIATTNTSEPEEDVGEPELAISPTTTREPQETTDQLNEILEPNSVLVVSFGDDWVKQDQWPIEAYTDVATGCPAFDHLLKIDDRGGYKATWSDGTNRLSQQVASLGFEAQTYLDTAQNLPDLCPTIHLGSLDLNVANTDLDGVVAYQLSAFPIPDPGRQGQVPDFDIESQAWVITLRRANVISVLTIEANGGLNHSDVDILASIARNALDSAEPDSLGPVTRPEEPEPQTPGSVPGTHTLTFDATDCRNNGSVSADGLEWQLVDPVPFEWIGLGPQPGELTIIDEYFATFVAGDGTELRVTIGGQEALCISSNPDDR